MPLYRRPSSPYWWTRISVRGQKIRRSTETADRAEAEAFEARLRAEALDELPVRRAGYTWDQAALRFLEDHAQKRSLDTDKTILRWLKPYLTSALLVDIGDERLDEIRKAKARETSESRADRVMALVNTILHEAHGRGWIRKLPKVRMFRPETPDFRWLTQEQFEALAAELPPHLAAMARFAVSTGLRRANVTGLLWRDVNLRAARARVWRSTAKGKQSFAVPLNASAVAVLEGLERDGPYVFTYHGSPVEQVATRAWRAAVKRAGIEPGFRFHDLRHTWASWHVQAGTPLTALMELGGWRSLEMVRRYAHFGGHHLADYAASVSLDGAQDGGTVPDGPGIQAASA